ncbi:hypothetical protein TWF696_002208 [Orbilia brochopaga]|uniref:Conidiation-specific protein 6 n=1 Tax=Orbilia brochopaga TaxID=3140254 RepID=A0AAV9U4H2_9PEZI
MNEETPNQIRGYKSTLTNPNTSEEAKENARQIINKNEGTQVDDGKDQNAVARGLKSAISNPKVSQEAKESAQDRLDKM